MLCQECSKKSECVELCQKAEKWVNSDHVSQRELIFSQIQEGEAGSIRLNTALDLANFYSTFNHSELSSYFTESEVCFPFLSDLQNKCLHLFYFQGLTYKQIAQHLSGGHPNNLNNIRAVHVRYQLYWAKQSIIEHMFKNRGDKI